MVDAGTIDLMGVFWGIIGVISVVLAYKLAKFFIMAKSETKAALRMQIQDLKDVVEHHKKEAQRARGRVGNMMVKPTIDALPENPEEFEGKIRELIRSYGSMAPKWMQPFIQDEKMISFLIQQAKNNPDAAKSMLSNFVFKPKTDNTATGSPDGQPPNLYSEFA